jgi:hypothetical protein
MRDCMLKILDSSVGAFSLFFQCFSLALFVQTFILIKYKNMQWENSLFSFKKKVHFLFNNVLFFQLARSIISISRACRSVQIKVTWHGWKHPSIHLANSINILSFCVIIHRPYICFSSWFDRCIISDSWRDLSMHACKVFFFNLWAYASDF